MWYRMIIIPAVLVTIYGHTPKNNSDVIVTYSGHHEAREMPAVPIIDATPVTIPTIQRPLHTIDEPTTPAFIEETESIVFIPNDMPVTRHEIDDYLAPDNKLSIADILTKGKSIGDILEDKKIRVETETEKQDILFISGKNKERESTVETPKRKEKGNKSVKKMEKQIILNCSNLDCNNTIHSTCGRKREDGRWRYRQFLNECYFRKVNCNFKYAENRFDQVPLFLCNPVAHHYSDRPFFYQQPKSTQADQMSPTTVNYRRMPASRRSMNKDMNGQLCAHSCPLSCPNEYEPECAVSVEGVKRVFLNHCKLDFNSCISGIVWHRRPLAECVGGQKADLTRNSAFIGWMQRVGIVDKKGRLTLQ